MKINEIFHSVQGEGTMIGLPAIFVRLAGCNLHCSFCDTKYSWDSGIEMPITDVIAKIKSYPSCTHVVWTGGEPSLQMADVLSVIQLLPKYTHEIESNGTTYFNPAPFFLVTISPKKEQIDVAVLEKFVKFNRVVFKFVISNLDDITFWMELVEVWGINRRRVFLMPEATTRDELHLKSEWLIERCKELNVRFSTRLHIDVWGARRGV